jgi:hypothetical protein
MTIPAEDNRREYDGDGTTSPWSFPIYFLANSDLVVIRRNADETETTLVYGTHYTISGAGTQAGGTVTPLQNTVVGATYIIYRDPPITQTLTLQNGSPLPVANIVRALDKGTMIDQRLSERITESETTFADVSQRLTIEEETRANADAALASLIGSTTGTIIFLQFDSRLAASLATIDDSVQQFKTAGWAAPGDFGGDHYFRVNTEPSHERKVQSLDGAWWEGRGLVVYLEMFGAKGIFDADDETTWVYDDAPAINAALDYFRGKITTNGDGLPTRTKGALYARPNANYQIFSTLNFSGFRAKFHFYGQNAQISAYSLDDAPMIDGLWSRGLHVCDLTIYAENGSVAGSGVQPSYGIVLGRKNGGDDASEHHFENVKIDGWFNRSAMMSIATEVTTWRKCVFSNAVDPLFVASPFAGFAIHLTADNEASFTSEWQGDASGIAYSMNENKFDQCILASAQGSALRMKGTTAGTKFLNSYSNCKSTFPIAVMIGKHAGFEWDVHCEVSAVSIFYAPDSPEGPVSLPNFCFKDHGLMVPAIFARESGSTFLVTAGRIEVSQVPLPEKVPKVAATGTGINFHGRLELAPDEVSLVNFTGFNSLRGELWTGCATADITNRPLPGYLTVYSAQDNAPTYLE